MKRKIIFLISLVLLISGCSINYNLEIDTNNTFKEDFTINANIDSLNDKESLYLSFKDEYPIYNDEEFMYYNPYGKNSDFTYYTKSSEELDNGYRFNYKDSGKYSDIKRLRSINTAFNNFAMGYLKDKESYYISASDPIIYKSNSNLENFTINVTFKNATIIEHNASKVIGNTYTWNITPNNGNINIKYKLINKNNSNNNSTSNQNQTSIDNSKTDENPKQNNIIDYILLATVILVLIVFILGIIKYKSVNKDE